jgi:hypothetical protein
MLLGLMKTFTTNQLYSSGTSIEIASPGFIRSLDYVRLYSPSVKKGKGRNNTLSEVICICSCGMYLRVPEGSIWRLPSEQVGGV